MLDSRTNLTTEVLREIDQYFGAQLAKTRIRNNVKLAEAPSFGRTIFEHAPDSNGARDYEAVAQELLEKLGMQVTPVEAAKPAPKAEEEPPAAEAAAEG
jgi:chromosome partitioning protein